MVKQLQKKPQQGLSYRRTNSVADNPEQLPDHSSPYNGGFMNLFQIKSEEEMAESKKERLKQHLEMLLCANLDPQLRRDTIADLTRRIHTLESAVDSLNKQLDQNIKEYKPENSGLIISKFENLIALADTENDILLDETEDNYNSSEKKLRALLIDGMPMPGPEPLKQIALTLIICKEKLAQLSRLFEQTQAAQSSASEAELSSSKCCGF